MKSLNGLILIPLAAIGISMLAGCGSSGPTVDMAAEKASLDKVDMAVKIFNDAGGDQSKVSPEDKAKLIATFGDQAKVNSIWAGLSTRSKGPGATHAKP
jgi:hypothetical protein